MITMQMLFPSIGKTHIDLDTTLENASKKVVNIAEKYGVPQTVQEHGLFDPSYYGKPQSVLRLALASARAGEEQTINNEYVMKVFDEFYLKNVEGIMETWEDIFNRKGIEIVSLNEFDRMIMKFITAEESNDFGVGFNILAEHFVNSRTDEVALWRSLEDLKRKGKICEPKHDVYRSLPFE